MSDIKSVGNGWDETVEMEIPQGLNGWQNTGAVTINGKTTKVKVGANDSIPMPVATRLSGMISEAEESKQETVATSMSFGVFVAAEGTTGHGDMPKLPAPGRYMLVWDNPTYGPMSKLTMTTTTLETITPKGGTPVTRPITTERDITPPASSGVYPFAEFTIRSKLTALSLDCTLPREAYEDTYVKFHLIPLDGDTGEPVVLRALLDIIAARHAQ